MVETKTDGDVYLRDLGGGLILRRAVEADGEALADFNARVHSEAGPNQPDESVRAEVLDMIAGRNPAVGPGDFTIVEDRRTGEIVSSMCLISQTWSYAGIPFGVGRPELVATLPEYRDRGLVRAQFEVVHDWSARRGEAVQAITGLPYFYRKFGYEMCLNLGGGRLGFKANLPALEDGQQEPYKIRPAGEGDLPFIAGLARDAWLKRYLVNCERDEALWRYELEGKSEKNLHRVILCLIEDRDGQRVGLLTHPPYVRKANLLAMDYELTPGHSWGAVTPSVIRYLYATGEAYAARDGKADLFAAFGFWLGEDHPVYQVLGDAAPRLRKPYAWYLRVPDLPDFVSLIAPALEKRLAISPYAGHSGELKITFYQRGLLLVFEAGRLVKASDWRPAPRWESGDAAFPGLTFLQLLFGYRSLEELEFAFPDCWWDGDEAGGLLRALFPRQVSNLWPVG